MINIKMRAAVEQLSFFCIVFISFAQSQTDIYSFSVSDIHGKLISMEQYRGKVLLVVNVASECGYTDSHYTDLVRLKHDLGKGGSFEVLAFPCNQFGSQEPKDSPEILSLMTAKYGINFPVFHKINVINRDVPPLWRYLEERSSKVPSWNFWKYLIDSTGAVINAWGPRTQVNEIYPEIQRAVSVAEQTMDSPFRGHQDL